MHLRKWEKMKRKKLYSTKGDQEILTILEEKNDCWVDSGKGSFLDFVQGGGLDKCEQRRGERTGLLGAVLGGGRSTWKERGAGRFRNITCTKKRREDVMLWKLSYGKSSRDLSKSRNRSWCVERSGPKGGKKERSGLP